LGEFVSQVIPTETANEKVRPSEQEKQSAQANAEKGDRQGG
jgi:hypothetical protein